MTNRRFAFRLFSYLIHYKDVRKHRYAVATHTWTDLRIPEAARLADLSGISWDLRSARQFAEMLTTEFATEKPNWQIVEPLSIAIAVMYSRPFMEGARLWLGNKDLAILTPEQRAAHDHLRFYRDKHVAHSVNSFEENIPRAQYCVERVKEEGITAIGHGGGRVTGLSGAELSAVIELTTVLQTYVDGEIAKEQQRLLEIVRKMPLEDVLAGGQKAFVVDSKTRISERRKR